MPTSVPPSRRRALGWLGLPLLGTLAPARAAGDYPARPVRILVPFTPGGSSDILARAIGQELGRGWQQPVVVENVPGAGGTLASERAARSAADGHTLFMGHTGTLAVNPWLYPRLRFDPLAAFAPVAAVAGVPNVLVVHPSVPAASLAELLAHAKARPGQLAYGSGGNGSAAHLTMEYLKLQTGLQALHVPYKGTAPSVNDLLGGQVQLLFTGAPALLPHIRAGGMRAIAVSSARRLPQLPDVPTVAETGVAGTRGFEADQWYGLVAPAGTPAAVVQTLNMRVNQALASEGVRARLATEGADPMPITPQAFGQWIAKDKARWEAVIKAAHVTVE
ncbi:tripartite tricarboxylate transporter substrate binding protein [Pseudorhodoferax sp. Leaf274]|uniref:Bug family tripartite tricarboxylate transporter substrate binding protein n=1 Tax=Pseudorhodoferax sp. Leaf274 TaxID=1736318 RepID=UPI000703B374|nr:tripartite tricarboxylate transporter substrate binding protein [Pseudorhodoferax sp. Leaf274]KQP35577.1 ABC transporter substrate-binding protein [Pseudorhodoferax sp. Leaf274]